MKKNLIRVLTCALALASVMALTACGNGGSSSTASSAVSSTASSKVESKTASSTPASSSEDTDLGKLMSQLNDNGKFNTVEDFVNSDLIQSQLGSLQDSAAESGMDISIAGEGDKLVYTFKFEEGTDTEGLAESLEAALATQAATFEGVAASIKEAVEVENPAVVVKYVDSTGAEIYSQEFTAK